MKELNEIVNKRYPFKPGCQGCKARIIAKRERIKAILLEELSKRINNFA